MNTEELKKLAMAATPGPRKFRLTPNDLDFAAEIEGIACFFFIPDARYAEAVNPATILSLIAERDEALAELHVIESIINGESITTDAGYDTYRRANFIRRTFEKLDRAQAEIRALELRLLEES